MTTSDLSSTDRPRPRRAARAAGRRFDLMTLVNPLIGLPALWLLGLALSQIHIFTFQRSWPAFVWLLVFLAPAAFVAGGWVGRAVVMRYVVSPSDAVSPLGAGRTRRMRILVVACVLVGYAELVHQFVVAGSVPLFADNIDAARASAPNGPTVVLTDLLTVATILALITPRRLFSRAALPELTIAAIAAAGFLLAGGRGTIAIGLGAAAVGRMLLWGPPRRRVVLGCLVLALAAVSALFFIRSGQHQGNHFEHELFTSVIPSTPLVLRPYLAFHVGLTTNFYALERLTEFFPSVYHWGHGAYSLSGFDAVVPGAHSLQDVSANISSPFITSTAAGPYFADFGLAGVVVGMALFGAATVAGFVWAHRAGTLTACMVGGYLTYMGLFGVYTNLFTEHPDWAIVIPCLLLAGRFVTLPAEFGVSRAARAVGADARWYASRLGSGGARITRRLRSAPTRMNVPTNTRSSLRRRRLLLLPVVVAALVVVAVIAQSGHKSAKPKPAPVAQSDRFALPAAAFAQKGFVVATDSDLPQDNAPLWVFERPRGGKRIVRQFLFSGPRAQEQVTSLKPAAEPGGATYAVARWTGGEPAAFQITPRTKGVAVKVFSLDGNSTVQSRGLAPLPAPDTGEREVAIATWNAGELPSLWVIDHGQTRQRVEISVFSGRFAFRKRIAQFTLPLRDLPNSSWKLSISRGIGTRPNFVGLLRKGTSERPEVHVLSGDANFQQFALQTPLARRSLPSGAITLPGSTLGRPSVYVVDPKRAQLQIYPYAGPAATPAPPPG